VAITSVGYEGTVDEGQWARLASRLGADYWVEGASHWRVTPVSSADRTVRIATGTGGGHGVRDTSDSEVTVQGEVASSGSRWDLVVAHRDWQDDLTTFEIITGTSTKQIPSGRDNNPGVVDDQPIALVRFTAGQQLPTEIIDLRCWHGNGGVVAASTEALSYLGAVGSQVTVDGVLWVRELDTQDSPVWVRPSLPAADLTGEIHPNRLPTVPVGLIPYLPASRVNSGEFHSNRIPNLPASRTTSGVFSTARIPTLPYSKIPIIAAAGSVDISFSSRDTYTRSVSFPSGRFSSSPKVFVNINSAAGVTSGWVARATSVTATGFTLFLYQANGVSTAWSDHAVHWFAVDEG
jgi:hypothetical protein